MPDDRAAFLRGAIFALDELRPLLLFIYAVEIRTVLQNWLETTITAYKQKLAAIPPPAAGPGWDLVEQCEKAFKTIGSELDVIVEGKQDDVRNDRTAAECEGWERARDHVWRIIQPVIAAIATAKGKGAVDG